MSCQQVSETSELDPRTRVTAPEAGLVGIGARSLILSVLLIFATYVGITRTGFIRICWVPYVIPPVPASCSCCCCRA